MKLAVLLFFATTTLLFAESTPSSVVLTSSPNPAVFGRPVTLVATAVPPLATGSVTFYEGTTVLGTAKLTAGLATLTTILLPSGACLLKAHYSGDATYAPSTSATLAQAVNTVAGGGDFQAAVTYGAGANPYSIVVGDFNKDGSPDLVVANLYVTDVSVLLGNGDGTFRAPVNYGAGGAQFVAVGDFNGDGNPDLVIANYGISVLLGNGDGTFQPPMNYAAGSSPASIAVGDFNGDGKADLAVATEGGVSVLLGNGNGSFKAPLNYAAGSSASTIPPGVNAGSIVVGDFNGDGNADIAVTNYKDNNLSVFLGNGDGTFQVPTKYATGIGPGSLTVGDFNGDGKADLATANDGNNSYYTNNGNGGVSVLLGNGDGTFRTAKNYGAGYVLRSIAAGDFNGDGRTDLAAANYTGNVSVFFGNGDGTFQGAVNYGAGDILYSVAVGDLNGDGRTDLVTANSDDVSVLLGLAAAPELSIMITHTGNFTQGQNGGTFSITVSNVGYSASSGTLIVTDSLPTGLVATNISGMGWNCVLNTITCSRGDPLARFTSYPAITVTVNVAVGASGGSTNIVLASGGGQTSVENAIASDFITTFTPTQSAQRWSSLSPPASLSNAAAALLLTDGTVVVHQWCSSIWYRLAPDAFGSYATGTWSQVASMPPGYGPGDFSSAVLADGRLVVMGGEYNSGVNNACTPVDTNLGAIYDPAKNIWTPLSAPSGWLQIGDAQNAVLPDGQFLLASLNYQLARLDPTTLTWTILNGLGKADRNDEEGWTLLPDGSVLTVDVLNGTQSERYLPLTDSWVPAGATVSELSAGGEIGPQVLRPDGSMLVVGASGHTGVYDAVGGTWAAGPDLPVSNGERLFNNDGPASLLPSGNVLVTAFNSQSNFFFEFDGARFNPAPAPPGGGCYELLSLPTGQVLCTGGSNIDFYTPTGNPDPAWAPTLASAPSLVQPGLSYAVTGTQFNGLSQAVGYGDDYQGATNYPLVRITNTATGHVFYCRTHNHSTMGVATGSALVSTQFDVPSSIELGSSTLVVVANGIASSPWAVTVNSGQSQYQLTISVSPAAGGTVIPATGSFYNPGAVVPITASANSGYTFSGWTGNVTSASSPSTTVTMNAAQMVIAHFSPAPLITSGGIVPIDGSVNTIQPGEWVSIYGTNLANLTATWTGTFTTSLAGTSVTINGKAAYLSYVSPTQINLQAPDDVTIGLVPVLVTTASGGTATSTVTLAQIAPSFLLLDSKHVAGIILRSNGSGAYGGGTYDILGPTGSSLGYATVAAKAGDSVVLFGVGFGPTSPAVPSGEAFSGAAPATNLVNLLIGKVSITPSFAGLSAAGLYQINLTVPSGIGAGDVALVATVGGAQTPPTVAISLQ